MNANSAISGTAARWGRIGGGLLTLLLAVGACAPTSATPSSLAPGVPGASPTGSATATAAVATSGSAGPSATSGVAEPSATGSARESAHFVATGSMAVARTGPVAIPLRNGSVLVAGGCNCATTELYLPETGSFSATGPMLLARSDGMTATALVDGRVLFAGGRDPAGRVLAEAEIYDPARGTFAPTGSMNTARAFHAADPLRDGRVLILGGFNDTGDSLASGEVYDPATGAFSPAVSMAQARSEFVAVPLADGGVLIAGGKATCAGDRPLASAELIGPDVASARPAGPLSAARSGSAGTVLASGRVLIAGGNASCRTEKGIRSGEVFDPAGGSFSISAPMTEARLGLSTVLLTDGTVLVVGGAGRSAEVFDPTTSAFSSLGSMTRARAWASATLLPNGEVLVAGGADETEGGASAELFVP